MKRLKLSTGTMGITRHPVSKPAGGKESPKVTCILHLHISLFHQLALHAKKKLSQISLFPFKCHLFCFLMSGKNA